MLVGIGEMTKMKVVRITAEEYELEDGTIYPMMFEFEDGELPSLEDFQEIYDNNFELVSDLSDGKKYTRGHNNE